MVYEPVAETVGHIRIEHTVGGNASQRLGYEILGIVGKYDVVCRFVGIVETHLYTVFGLQEVAFGHVAEWFGPCGRTGHVIAPFMVADELVQRLGLLVFHIIQDVVPRCSALARV